jgi:hypothetical protein
MYVHLPLAKVWIEIATQRNTELNKNNNTFMSALSNTIVELRVQYKGWEFLG